MAFIRPLAAQAPPTTLVGATLPELAAHPALAATVRNAARGRQQKVYEGLHMPGPRVALAGDHTVFAWGCADADAATLGCRSDGLFLAYDTADERLYLLLLRGGAPEMLAPRGGRWPAELQAPLKRFAPGSAASGA